MQQKYGSGDNVFDMMMGHLDEMSREIAAMEGLGTNVKQTLKQVKKSANSYFKKMEDAGKLGRWRKRRISSYFKHDTHSFLDRMYDVYSGAANIPVDEAAAQTGQTIRNYLISTQLGGAMLSALSDMGFAQMASYYNGIPLGRTLGKQIKLFAPGSKADQQFAVNSALGADQWTATAATQARFTGEIPAKQWSATLSDSILRASGLVRWTEAGRWAFGIEYMGMLASQAKKSFNDIDGQFKQRLETYGFTAAEWDEIRRTPITKHEGAEMLVPGDLIRKNRALGERLLIMLHSEQEYAVPSSSLRGRTAIGRDIPKGTLWGETVMSGTMYKAFAATLFQTHLKRIWRQGTWKGTATAATAMLTATTLMGAMSLQLKDISRGKKPRPMNTFAFWLAAMVQGGGLGIFGDFITSDMSRFGASFGTTVAGPVWGFFTDITRLGNKVYDSVAEGENKWGSEVTYLGLRYTPVGSLWYTRIAVERLVADQIQMLIDPKYRTRWRTREQNMRREKGQEFYWKPGELSPDL